jgi:hypothetical protein
MVKSIERVLTFFVVLILILLLLNLLGPFIADSIEPAANRLGDILRQAWDGLQNLADTGYRH